MPVKDPEHGESSGGVAGEALPSGIGEDEILAALGEGAVAKEDGGLAGVDAAELLTEEGAERDEGRRISGVGHGGGDRVRVAAFGGD